MRKRRATVTSLKMRTNVKLTSAQERFLVDLLEPNGNERNTWYFPARNWPTANCLIEKGFVRQEDEGSIRRGFSLTVAGRARANEIADEFVVGKRHAV